MQCGTVNKQIKKALHFWGAPGDLQYLGEALQLIWENMQLYKICWTNFTTVLGIRDILVRIQIRIPGSVLWLMDPDPTPEPILPSVT